MKITHTLSTIVLIGVTVKTANAQFLLDFNSNQAGGGEATAADPIADTALENETGYQSYHINHESAAHVNPATAGVYETSFSITGAATVTVLPDWGDAPNNVRQSIGRGNLTWDGEKINLISDWIGIDSRPGGNWDGTTGTPTYMTLAIGGLPAANYTMRTYHHDNEHMNSFFTTEISTDGGATYGPIINARMTNSLAGGTPAENEILQGTEPNVAGGDPADLSSTQNLTFTANGADDVVLRFAPLGTGPVHRMFFGLNGFDLDQEGSLGEFAVKEIKYDEATKTLDLTWPSIQGQVFSIEVSTGLNEWIELSEWNEELDARILAAENSDETTYSFPAPDQKLFTRVRILPN
ncbi:MAG: hypothetical protein P1U90_04760 [Akkermansiaceae bacterium]|jgi:hypothetical protein|nr:hypothetical protein [Akkermansiaceae bacterium]